MARDTVTVPRFNHVMKHLSVWRNADHEDNLTLCRSDIIEIIEGVKAIESAFLTPPPSPDPEGGARGVQGSIATKQATDPESDSRTETCFDCGMDAPCDEKCPNCNDANEYGDYEGPTCEVCGGIGRIHAACTKSAPGFKAPHNSGERDPSVMPDCSGADTKSDGGVK